MVKKVLGRRKFLKHTSAAVAGAAAVSAIGKTSLYSAVSKSADTPAILGGIPVRTKPFPSWPVFDKTDEKMLLEAFHSKKWCRLGGSQVESFEKKFAELMEVPYCVATNSGTTALNTSLNVIGVGPGDASRGHSNHINRLHSA